MAKQKKVKKVLQAELVALINRTTQVNCECGRPYRAGLEAAAEGTKTANTISTPKTVFAL